MEGLKLNEDLMRIIARGCFYEICLNEKKIQTCYGVKHKCVEENVSCTFTLK